MAIKANPLLPWAGLGWSRSVRGESVEEIKMAESGLLEQVGLEMLPLLQVPAALRRSQCRKKWGAARG